MCKTGASLSRVSERESPARSSSMVSCRSRPPQKYAGGCPLCWHRIRDATFGMLSSNGSGSATQDLGSCRLQTSAGVEMTGCAIVESGCVRHIDWLRRSQGRFRLLALGTTKDATMHRCPAMPSSESNSRAFGNDAFRKRQSESRVVRACGQVPHRTEKVEKSGWC